MMSWLMCDAITDSSEGRNRDNVAKTIFAAILLLWVSAGAGDDLVPDMFRPNVVLIMSDDQGWGQTGYYGHPVLQTPNLDAMAANGLRFDRFYAASPVCSPTRASVLTGRAPDRAGVPEHGFALRRQEKTLAQALQAAGYATGHFGKWHLNGLRGPGVPVFGDDPYGPGVFGFEEWLSVTNFFDINPVMSRNGRFESFKGDSSGIIVDEALAFMDRSVASGKPFLAVIWDGSPHAPWRAAAADLAAFSAFDEDSQNHHGELVAFDRAVGTLRAGLRALGVAENTLLWFNSDNGGLEQMTPPSTGGLRGNKGTLWEGGLRVPGIVEWPAVIQPGATDYRASTMDIFPTIAEILGLSANALRQPIDGSSLLSLFEGRVGVHTAPLTFRFRGGGALVEDRYKLVSHNVAVGEYSLYDLQEDPAERIDVAASLPETVQRMKGVFEQWNASVEASVAGADYPGGTLDDAPPGPRFWTDDPRYEPWFEQWADRPEYRKRLRPN